MSHCLWAGLSATVVADLIGDTEAMVCKVYKHVIGATDPDTRKRMGGMYLPSSQTAAEVTRKLGDLFTPPNPLPTAPKMT